jgi:glycosyltransferase involved in cell wall biosynthesis
MVLYNYILTDFKTPLRWPFLLSLKEESNSQWVVWQKISNNLHGNNTLNFIRVVRYFLCPLELLIKRRKLKTIIAWQQFYGLNFAFWSRLLGLKKKQTLVIMTFIYKPKKGLIGQLYYHYMSYIIHSDLIDLFICFSKNECELYSEIFNSERKLFQYVPLGIERISENIIANIDTYPYIFSTGRSNRDYNFLIDALKNEDYTLHIACDTINYKSETPSNVIINRNCYGEEMLNEMAKCKCVVVILQDTTISSGQLVILQAMQLGKPVIATKSLGVSEYIEDGVNGVLIENNKTELLNALSLLFKDQEFYNRLSINSKEKFDKNFSLECLAQNIHKAITSLD